MQEKEEPVDVEIEVTGALCSCAVTDIVSKVDENWLMSPEELMALEREL